jgi:heat shock protein HspQ
LYNNIAFAIENKQALPVTCAAILILAAKKLGLKVNGCNIPGHFMASAMSGKNKIIIDCFNGGKIFKENEINIYLSSLDKIKKKNLLSPCSFKAMCSRILRNLTRAYQMKKDRQKASFFFSLLQDNEGIRRLNTKNFSFNTKIRLFEKGHLVIHNKYSYRGVIVDYDPVCRANDEWYYSNRSFPDRDQHWYYIIVHNSNYSTYAAQSNLMPDESEKKVNHPLIKKYFYGFDNGIYLRNDRVWLS